jgi:hypothetical protein
MKKLGLLKMWAPGCVVAGERGEKQGQELPGGAWLSDAMALNHRLNYQSSTISTGILAERTPSLVS